MERGAGNETQVGAGPGASEEGAVEGAERTAARVSELAASLIEYASNATREADLLLARLREAAGPAAAPEASINSEPEPTLSMGARVLVSQLVVGGASRSEIEQRLREDFGIDDSARALDAILGSSD